MSLIAFTKNYTDRSNDNGYQFEFHCDKCGNGFMSNFQTSKLGVAQNLLNAASSLFGGGWSRAASAGNNMKDSLRGKAWDDAFAVAIGEGKQKFKQCSRCGTWVCPEQCWNAKKGLCEGCAPNLEEEIAAAQATIAKEQVWEKARNSNMIEGVDVKSEKTATCPHCGANAGPGKFCGECGKPYSNKSKCPKCGVEQDGHPKFCGECGQNMQAGT